VHGSIHGENFTGSAVSTAYALPNNDALSNKYHLYAVDWEPGKMTFFLDNHPYVTYTPKDLPSNAIWPFDSQPFYIILNLAIGGSWPGSPDSSTPFPAHLLIDYVRVYKAPPSKS
jgi:beta-glucanase (GH16 family)